MFIKNTIISSILVLCLMSGCAAPKEEPKEITLSDAHKKLITLCKEDYDMDVILTPLENTVWIYVPMEEPLFDYKADETPKAETKITERYSVKFIESIFTDSKFNIKFDITKENFYPADHGYSSKQTEFFSRKSRFLFNAITRSYFDINSEKDPGLDDEDKPSKEKVPDFFVLVFADIVKGISYKIIINIDDYKKTSMGLYPQEEYSLRMINEVKGNNAMIGDKTGKSLVYKEVLLQDFLASQIKNRINFKFTQSDFPPEENPEKEILNAVAITIKTYDFKDFEGITTIDLRNNITNFYSSEDLFNLEAQPAAPQGKIHVIRFN